MRADDAWYELRYGEPRRKYSPDHWYARVYWTGVWLGWGVSCAWRCVYRPVALLVIGFVRPWGDR